MKIMILAAATGGGHLRASNNLKKYIENNSSNTEVVIIDALKEASYILDKTCCDVYKFMARKAPKLFGTLYRMTNKPSPVYSMMQLLNIMFSKQLLKSIENESPDLILSTHPFATKMVSHLKEKGKINIPLICLITDYGAHLAWIAKAVDAYVVADKSVVPQMVEFGVDENKVCPFGIPVDDVFLGKADRTAILSELDLDPDCPTVLFMAGSFGVTNILSIYNQLSEIKRKLQIIVITGKNKKLYEAFEAQIKTSNIPTRLIYFTDRVADYMHCCDLLITKPGGLTVSEAIASNTLMALFDAIPGQEQDNAKFLISNNMAIMLDTDKGCARDVQRLLENQTMLIKMRKSCENFDRSETSQNILELIKDLVEKKNSAN